MAENEDEIQWRALVNALADAEEEAERDAGWEAADILEPEEYESEESDWTGEWSDNEEDWLTGEEEEEEEHPRVNENAAAVHEGGGEGRGEELEEERRDEEEAREQRRAQVEAARDAALLRAVAFPLDVWGDRPLQLNLFLDGEEEEEGEHPRLDENAAPVHEGGGDGRGEEGRNERDLYQIDDAGELRIERAYREYRAMEEAMWGRRARREPGERIAEWDEPLPVYRPYDVPPPVPQGGPRAPMAAAPPPPPPLPPHLHQPNAGANLDQRVPEGPAPPVPPPRHVHLMEPPRDPAPPHHHHDHHHDDRHLLPFIFQLFHPHAGIDVPPGPNPLEGVVVHGGVQHDVQVWIGRLQENANGQRNGGGDGGKTVTAEMIKEAEALRNEDNESDPSPSRYSRACPVCAVQNPKKRAVFVQCGHICCYPCAVQNSRIGSGNCVNCRREGGFIKLFEDEVGAENG